jgi:hypothetical protein
VDEQETIAAAGYALAAITMQMALLNSLAGQGGVPVAMIEQLISRARVAAADSGPEFSDQVIDAAIQAIDRIELGWKNMERSRH